MLLSLNKLLLLVAIISAVWFGFRLLGQIERKRRDVTRREKQRRSASSIKPRQVDDMVKCEVCGTFNARSSKSCGKAGCPF